MLGAGQKRLDTVPGFQHGVAMQLQRIVHQPPHARLVFHQQDRFLAAGLTGRSGARLRRVCGLVGAREQDSERGSMPRSALHGDMTAALLDDPVDGRESESRSLAFLFCGEEGLEQMRLRLLIHAATGVLDRQHHVRTGIDRLEIPSGLVNDLDAAGFNGQGSAGRHGVVRVDRQVHDDLLDLSGIGLDHADVRIEHRAELDEVLADQPSQHGFHARHEHVEIHQLRRDELAPAEGEQLGGQARGAIGGLLDFLDVLAQRVRRT